MMKLYFAPKTRSTRPRWMLEELGLPYELPAEEARGRKRFAEAARVLEDRLRGRDFPGLQAYVQRHMARPAARRAMK